MCGLLQLDHANLISVLLVRNSKYHVFYFRLLVVRQISTAGFFLLELLFLWQTAVRVTVEYIQKQTGNKEHQHIKKVVVAAYDKHN